MISPAAHRPNMTNGCLLLTAAITPSPGLAAALVDPQERLRQYVHAAAKWSGLAEERQWAVVVVETTGFPLSRLYEQLDTPAHLLSYTPTRAELHRGKGAVEASAIEYVLNTLQPPPQSLIVKVTGRLTVANSDILPRRLSSSEIAVRRTLDRSYADTRLFAFNSETWVRCLVGLSSEVDEQADRYLEHALAHRIAVGEYNGSLSVKRFPRRPIFLGASGTTGRRYGGTADRLRGLVMNSLEAKLPKIGRKQL